MINQNGCASNQVLSKSSESRFLMVKKQHLEIPFEDDLECSRLQTTEMAVDSIHNSLLTITSKSQSFYLHFTSKSAGEFI